LGEKNATLNIEEEEEEEAAYAHAACDERTMEGGETTKGDEEFKLKREGVVLNS
jgi:hypothetical protein